MNTINYLDKIWANRLIAKDKLWNEVPEVAKTSIREELQNRVNSNEITQEYMNKIIGA